MDIRQLRHMMAIHRTGSFAKAAEQLGLAQSTLSKSIARLEDQLGLRLFERSGAGAVVTPMGAVVIAGAERIVEEAERLRRDVELAAAGDLGEIRIGMGPAFRPRFLPRFTEATVRRWPRLKLMIDVERRERLILDYRAGRYDVILLAHAAELEEPENVISDLMREPIVAVAAPDHPLAALSRISPDAFLAHPHAAASATSMLTAPGAVLGERPTRPDEPLIQCSDDQTVLALAKAGLATAFASRHLARPEIEAGRLVPLPLDWRLTLRLVAVTTRAAQSSPVVQGILGLARETAEILRAQEEGSHADDVAGDATGLEGVSVEPRGGDLGLQERQF